MIMIESGYFAYQIKSTITIVVPQCSRRLTADEMATLVALVRGWMRGEEE